MRRQTGKVERVVMKMKVKALFTLTAVVFLFTANIASAVYDAELGRWLSRDPIEEEGGVNLYSYILGNPINGYDPLGLEPPSSPRCLSRNDSD